MGDCRFLRYHRFFFNSLFKWVLILFVFLHQFSCKPGKNEKSSFPVGVTDIKIISENFKKPNREYGPWVYWFWFENVVSKAEITRELEEMTERGIAGVELRCVSMRGFAGGSPGSMFNPEDWKKIEHRKLEYFSPEFIQTLKHTLTEAKRLGLKFSLNLGMGWPPGGRWITYEYRTKHLISESFEVKGTKKITKTIDLTGVYHAQVFAWPLLSERTVDEKAFLDLSGYCDSSGNFSWNVPPGNWLVGIFKTVPGGLCDKGEGPEVDPASKDAVLFHLEKLFVPMDSVISEFYGTTLVDMASDSWEYAINRNGGRYWSPEILKSASTILGYSFEQKMHALVGYGPAKENILHDLEMLENSLITKNYFETIKVFLHQRGLKHRPQIYGRGLNRDFYQAYSIADQCEIEEGVYIPEAVWITRLMNKPVISCEAFTFASRQGGNLRFNGHQGQKLSEIDKEKMWTTTPEYLKKLSNAHFARGVNRIQMHSFSYSPPEVPYPGWRMYAEIHLNRNIPWWDELNDFSTWVARNQYLLQSARSVTDLLVYPVISNPADGPFNMNEGQPNSAKNAIDGADSFLLDKLVRVSRMESQIKNVLIINDIKTVEEVENLALFIERRIPIWCCNIKYNDWSAFKPNENNRHVSRLKKLFNRAEQKKQVINIMDRSWQEIARKTASVKWDDKDGQLSYQHFTIDNARLYFLASWEEPFNGEIFFPNMNGKPEKWDAKTGEISPVACDTFEGGIKMRISLSPNESIFIVSNEKN
jgi:hypothetical protein